MMFSSFEMNYYMIIENVNVVILFLGLLLGLLLGYRYKLKDRSNSTEIKDDDKIKKDKGKSKKLFLKSKEKQNINGVRNRKNEPFLNESQDEKMGLLHSKDSHGNDFDKANLPEKKNSIPLEDKTKPEICNGTAKFKEQQKYPSLERRFLSDELKPSINPTVKRQSSIKVLHDSIGAQNVPNVGIDSNKDEDSKENNISTVETDVNSNISVKKESIIISVSISEPCEEHIVETSQTNTKKNVNKSPKFDRAGSSISKLVNSLNYSTENDTKKMKNKDVQIELLSNSETNKNYSDQPKVIINNEDDIKELDIRSEIDTEVALIALNSKVDAADSCLPCQKPKNETDDSITVCDSVIFDKAVDKDINTLLLDDSNTSNLPDLKPVFMSSRNENTINELDASTTIELFTEPKVSVEVVEQCYNANNIDLEFFLHDKNTVSTVVNDKNDNNIDITSSCISDKVIENISDQQDFDAIVAANSISSEIWSNVLDDLKLFSKKTVINSYSDNLADVIINDNSIQHEIIDECDAGPKEVNSSFSHLDDDKSKSNKIVDENDKGVSVVMSINENGNLKTNLKGKHDNNNLNGSPLISSNNVKSKKDSSRNGKLSPDEVRKPTVVLRRKRGNKPSRNNLNSPQEDKRASFTGRPISHFADQLAELLANDDNVDFELDSDEELDNALEKIKETYQDRTGISSEIGKFQRKCSVAELKEYGAKNFKTKVKSRINDKKTKLKGDRPLSLYEQDLLADLLDEDEFDDYNEVAEDTIESVQSSVQLLEDRIPFNLTRNERSCSNLSNTSNEDYDSHDENTKSQSDPKMTSNGKAPRLGRAAVIDLGSGILKAGMCGDMEPSCYCPSVVGTPRRFSQDVSKMKKGYYVGDEAWTVAGMLSIDYPLNKSDVTNWPDVTRIVEHLLDSELKVNDRAHPIMLTEKGLVSKKHREKLTEIIFETFGVPAYFLANQAPLALYSMGVTTGVCLNAGFNCTQSTPVYEGHCLPHATVQFDIGGDHVTKQLGRILSSSQGHAFNSSSEKLVLNSMKQSLCYVSQDIQNEEDLYKRTTNMLQTYTLPDGQEIELGTERFSAPEILFNPQSIGINKANSAEIIHESMDLMEKSLHQELKENIVVSGGTSKFSGYGPRLEKELSIISDSNENYKVKYTENPLLATWIGGSVLSSIGSFRDQWITIDQYADYGSQIVHRYCF